MSETSEISQNNPATPKYLKQTTLPPHNFSQPYFPHILDIIDPDATKKAKRFVE
jgi:hypothetical protein